jgi:hypothetical protein
VQHHLDETVKTRETPKTAQTKAKVSKTDKAPLPGALPRTR